MSVLDRFKLDGKRALVTGASRGLGLQMALALAEAGAEVGITGRDAVSLKEAADTIRSRGRKAWTFQGDMSKPAECEATCEAALAEMGLIDILINNIGERGMNVKIEDTTLETWQHYVDQNLTSCFLATRIIGGAMLRRPEGGRIINTASISGMIANKGIAGRHYETTKAAVIHFTRCAAADWAPYGVRVNAICPGLFMTQPNRKWAENNPEVIKTFVSAVPMGRAGEPEELGPLAVFLASDASSYVTGSTFVIDGGYTIW
ncbi:glucose 1-dehydrogenase [Paraburkholderia sp. 1N]|uniref:Glucose 1-dehydrogenase n=1 Tax=Paraburkholderia solitsugae TaxID=2675748 RepID=A0ABX2BMJ7_9BURK|nr:glucose 1-dehydrogenase [Paraburkholderia solitsugae]NPT41290.1 glucose 1-dehydrogenase [Paraburkholderia solitsugae]